MIRQSLLILLLSCLMVSPIHAEDTYDASILEELENYQTAQDEADVENASNAVPTNPSGGSSTTDAQNGSDILIIEKSDSLSGSNEINSPTDDNTQDPLFTDIEFNQVEEGEIEQPTLDEAANEEATEQNPDILTEETGEQDSNPTTAETSGNDDTIADDASGTATFDTSPTTPSNTSADATSEVDNTQAVTDSTNQDTATASSSDTATTEDNSSSESTAESNNTSSSNVTNIPSQPIMTVNSEFADHWIDTRPQTAVIIELKKDANDDERFFYLYSDTTNQAGYSIETGNGTVTYNGDGTVTYTANAGFSGTDTFYYAYDGWGYGSGGYGRGRSTKAYGYGWQDYGYGSNYGKGWGYGVSESDIEDKKRYSKKRKRKAKTRVSKHLGSPIGPTVCQIYAVHDEGASDSQFVKFEVIDLQEKRTLSDKIGPSYPGFDIEAIAIHPITSMLYASSEDLLYLVHPSEASLKVVGEIGYDEITGFAFHPQDATLFAATDTDEKQKGILQIDPDTVASKMILPSSYEIEALAWNVDGTILYAAEKVKRPNKDGVMVKGSNLIAWYYDGTRLLGQGATETNSTITAPSSTRSARNTRSDTVVDDTQVIPDSDVDFLRLGLNVVGSMDTGTDIEINAELGAGGDSPFLMCEGFGTVEGEVESLETRADGMLLFSVDQGRGNKIYAFNPQTCEVQETTSFGTPYSDIEAIAWPIHCQSSSVPIPKGWDIEFIGNNGSFCVEEGKPFEIKGKVKLASKGFLNLKTSWQVVSPQNAKCPEIGEESGLANPNSITACPSKALKNSQMLTGNSDFTITAWWPGLTDANGNYFNTVEVRFTAELYDMLGTSMDNYGLNSIGGESFAARSVIATAEVCRPPEQATSAQLLSEFFINDYAIESDALKLGSGILTVRIEGQIYSGRLTDAMLASMEQGAPSSSFLDKNKDGIDDLIVVYADGSTQTLFAQLPVEEEPASENEPLDSQLDEKADNSDTASDSEASATDEDVDFIDYVAKFDEYLQQVLAQSEYDFDTDGQLSLILDNAEHLGQLSEQPIDKVEPFEGNILLGELTQDEQGSPYFPITFQDGQVFALYYLGESEQETQQPDSHLDDDNSSNVDDEAETYSSDSENDDSSSEDSSGEESIELLEDTNNLESDEEQVFNGEDDESGSDGSTSTIIEEEAGDTDSNSNDEESEY